MVATNTAAVVNPALGPRAQAKVRRAQLVHALEETLAAKNDPFPQSADGIPYTPQQGFFRRKALDQEISKLRAAIATVNAELQRLPPDPQRRPIAYRGNYRKPFGRLFAFVCDLEDAGRVQFTESEGQFLAELHALFSTGGAESVDMLSPGDEAGHAPAPRL